MVRSCIKVFLRARPSTPAQASGIQVNPDGKSVVLDVGPKYGSISDKGAGSQYQFKFDQVLSTATQEQVYEVCAADVVKAALQGYNGTVMCYGQTGGAQHRPNSGLSHATRQRGFAVPAAGAGKTYTMTGARGGKAAYQQRGIIPRVLTQLFRDIRGMGDVQCKVQVAYLEIYNEQLYDLLDITTQAEDITIMEDSKGRVTTRGLSTPTVHTEAEALAQLFEGETNRVIGEHQLNRESSRSHSIFSIMLEMKAGSAEDGSAVAAKINLVDLAGSERVSKTRSEGSVLREALHINKSLSMLEQVILALSDKGRDHVPYRSSKLTHVLKDSIGGNCKTALVANVWSDTAQLDESVSTCRFAQRMSRITCELSVNVVQDTSARARQLEREVADLKAELAMHDGFASRSGVQYGPYSEAQRQELRSQVQSFLASTSRDSLEPLQLTSLRHIKEILHVCKELFHSAGGAVGSSSAEHTARPPGGAALHTSQAGQSADSSHQDTSSTAAADASWQEYVGDEDGSEVQQGGGVGVAPAGARPASSRDDTAAHEQPSASTHLHMPAPDRQVAFEDYKLGPGQQKAHLLAENKTKVKQLKKRSRELALGINAVKRDLDSLKARGSELQAARVSNTEEGSQVLEAEEMDVAGQVRALKGQYKEQHSELQMMRSEVEYTCRLLEQCTQELVLEFSDWYEQTYGAPGVVDVADGSSRAHSESEHVFSSMGRLSTSSSNASVMSPSGTPKAPGTPGKSPKKLFSLAAPADDQADSDVSAYYNAQQVLYQKLNGAAHGPGSMKKNRSKGTFSTTLRTDIATKSPMDLGVIPHRRH